jgi:hypothetical protein
MDILHTPGQPSQRIKASPLQTAEIYLLPEINMVFVEFLDFRHVVNVEYSLLGTTASTPTPIRCTV